MQEYEDNQKVMEPPCYEEIIIDLFNLYKKGREYKNGTYEMPFDRMKAKYPYILDIDLKILNQYLYEVERYCEDVSSLFSNIYQVPGIPNSKEAIDDKARVIQICQARYTWLEEEQITSILNKVCWLANR